MRTTVTIQDKILDDLMRLTDARTRTEAVNRAIAEWVRVAKIREIKKLRGTLSFEDNLKNLRQREIKKSKKLYG